MKQEDTMSPDPTVFDNKEENPPTVDKILTSKSSATISDSKKENLSVDEILSCESSPIIFDIKEENLSIAQIISPESPPILDVELGNVLPVDEILSSESSPTISTSKTGKILTVDELLSSEFSSDVDSDMPLSAVPSDYRSKRTKKLSSPSRTSRLTEQARQKKVPAPLTLLIAQPLLIEPCLEREKLLTQLDPKQVETSSTPQMSPKINIGKVARHHRLHKQVSVIQTDEEVPSESSDDDEYYTNKHPRPVAPKIPEKSLINLDDDQHLPVSTDQRGKSPRRVERTDTVIYKGPKDKDKPILDLTNNEPPASPPPLSPTVVGTPTTVAPRSPNADLNHLQVPIATLRDIVPKSPYPTEKSSEPKAVFSFPDEERISEMLIKKYRLSCMLDLIKVIDTRMLSHHHSHTDSTRRHKHMTIAKRNQTPSPDSVHRKMLHHRRSRSKSPESISIHHHHHSPHSPSPSVHHLAKHSVAKSHHDSCESITDKLHHSALPPSSVAMKQHIIKELEEVVVNAAAKRLAQAKPPNNHAITESESIEMQALKIHECPKAAVKPSVTSESITANIATNTAATTHATTCTTPTTPTNNIPETKTTNTANATDNLCVSQSPSTPRQQQQHRQNQNQETPQGSSTSPANNQLHQKIANSPSTRNSAIPLHRRSSDSDLSITPKGRFFRFACSGSKGLFRNIFDCLLCTNNLFTSVFSVIQINNYIFRSCEALKGQVVGITGNLCILSPLVSKCLVVIIKRFVFKYI